MGGSKNRAPIGGGAGEANTVRDGGSNKVQLGQIGAAHGIRGEVRIKSFTEDPLAIKSYSPLLTNRRGVEITIEKARLQKSMVIARLKDVTDRNAAEALNGVKLFTLRDNLPEPDEDDFYHTDLIGLDAQLEDGTSIGQVAAVQNYGAGDVLEIRPTKGPTELLPFTKKVVPTINLNEGFLVIVPPSEIVVDEDEAFEAE